MIEKKQIYLDYASATPVDPRVFRFAEPYLLENIGNPSSLHNSGLSAKEAIETSRQKIASLLNAEQQNCIVFTSGVTEANNLAIKGTALRNKQKGTRLAASTIEHISVLNPLKDLQKQGFSFDHLPVDKFGEINLNQINKIVTNETLLTSVMYANNEIGTIEPIEQVSEIIHDKGHYLHVDACAAAGRIPIDVQKSNIDLLTLSSNDLGGPQGAGALYIKPGLKIQPIILGGGQERGLRSGTENIFAIAGMGEAARIAQKEMLKESSRLQNIRNRLIKEILTINESHLTGHPTQRLPHHASFRFGQIEGESILLNLNMYNIQISTGSACTSRTLEPSHVLLAIGLKHEEAHGSMVITLGRTSKNKDIPYIVKSVKQTVKRLRELSPL